MLLSVWFIDGGWIDSRLPVAGQPSHTYSYSNMYYILREFRVYNTYDIHTTKANDYLSLALRNTSILDRLFLGRGITSLYWRTGSMMPIH